MDTYYNPMTFDLGRVAAASGSWEMLKLARYFSRFFWVLSLLCIAISTFYRRCGLHGLIVRPRNTSRHLTTLLGTGPT